jgi:hypothetical protein
MTGNIVIAIIISLISLFVVYISIPANKRRMLFTILIFVSIILRFAVVFYMYRNGTDTIGTDGLLYHKEGIKIREQLLNGVGITGIKYSYTLYTAFIGVVYYIFGINRYIASYINIIFALVSGLILFKIALNHKYSLANAVIISSCFLYFPNLILWTADTRKEAFLIFVCFVCWLLIQNFSLTIERKDKLVHNCIRIAAICLLMWIGSLIRIYMFLPFMLGIITSQIILYKKKHQTISLVFTITIIAGGLLILIAAIYPLTRNYHAISFPKEQVSGIIQDVNSKITTLQAIVSKKNILKSILYCLTMPNPTHINIADIKSSGKTQFIVSIDMIIWYVCMFLILTGIYSAFKNKDSYLLGLLSFIASYIVINAVLAESVADTVYRYRAAIVGLSVLFIDGRVIKSIAKQLKEFVISSPPGSGNNSDKNYEILSIVQMQTKKDL